MWEGMDRRRFPRINYPCKIIVTRKQHKEKFSTETENIGVGGVCVILEKELVKFSEVGMVLSLDKSGAPIECLARAVWIVKRSQLEKYKPNQFDTGIEFVDIKDADRKKIEKVVEQCLNRETPQ